jgi:lipopolysaccharide export system protein LptA
MEGAAMSGIAVALSCALAASAPPVRVECDGTVEWRATDRGASTLVMAGGVRVIRGDAVLRSDAAEVIFEERADAPRRVTASGKVALEAPQFAAFAGVAEMVRRITVKPGGAAVQSYVIRMSRGGTAGVQLKSGDMSVTCAGLFTYDGSSREATLRGGVSGTHPHMRLSAAQAVVRFAPPPPKPNATPEGPGGKRPAAPQERIDRVLLAGGVRVTTLGEDGASLRSVRASRALYLASKDLLVLTGTPAPEIESAGIVLTAPEMRLYVAENRIESSTGKMKAVVNPSSGDER